MQITLTINDSIIPASWDEETDEIQTKTPVDDTSQIVVIKELKETFYVTGITRLLKNYKEITLKQTGL